jgi:nitrilase
LALRDFPMAETLSNDDNILTIGLAQIAPVWLDRAATLAKVESYVEQAARQGCRLVVFGEALVPGYPFWLELTDGARFNSAPSKASEP